MKLFQNGKEKTLQAGALSSFCSEIALMLGSGMLLRDGLESLAGACEKEEEKQLYQSVLEGVDETGSLSDALKKDERWPKYMAEMAGVGERTGRLEEVMQGLSKYYEREEHIRQTASSALAYPLMLGGMLVVIMLVMLWKVLPVLRRVLNGMGVSTSGTGGYLMRVGTTFGWIVMAVVSILIIAVIAVLLLLKTNKRAQTLSFVKKAFPPYRELSMKLSASRIASVLYMTLSGGFQADEALSMAADVITDTDAQQKVQTMYQDLTVEGMQLADSVKKSGLFDDLYCRMIRMGIEAGREDQVMQKITQVYEEQVEDGIALLVNRIEPTLIVVLSVVVGAILLSVILPMAGVLTSLL